MAFKYARWSLSSSTIIAGIVFVAWFVGLLFTGQESSALLIATVFSFSVWVTLFFAGVYKFDKESPFSYKVRRVLMKQPDVSDKEFLSLRPVNNTKILLAIRERMSRLLQVPACKIRRDTELIYYKSSKGYPLAYLVAVDVLNLQFDEMSSVPIDLDYAKSIDELAERIETLIEKYRK